MRQGFLVAMLLGMTHFGSRFEKHETGEAPSLLNTFAALTVERDDQEHLREDRAESVKDDIANRWSAKAHEALVKFIKRSDEHAAGNRKREGASGPALQRSKRRSGAEGCNPGTEEQ